jgi:hypothetical protein
VKCYGFSSWILIAKTGGKLKRKIWKLFGAQKKSPEVFVQKSNIQLAETTQMSKFFVDSFCRFFGGATVITAVTRLLVFL